MNIIETEDLIKGLPDDALFQEAQSPTGQVPQFLVVSEIQRRNDMRKRYQNAQNQQPQGTVSEQIISEGIGALNQRMPNPNQPPPMPQQMQQPQMSQQMPPQMMQQPMPQQGVPQMAGGGRVPTFDFTNGGYRYAIPYGGYPNQQAAMEAFMAGQNQPASVDLIESWSPGDWSESVSFSPDGQLVDPVAEARKAATPSGGIASLMERTAEKMGRVNEGIRGLFTSDNPVTTPRGMELSGPAQWAVQGVNALPLPGSSRVGEPHPSLASLAGGDADFSWQVGPGGKMAAVAPSIGDTPAPPAAPVEAPPVAEDAAGLASMGQERPVNDSGAAQGISEIQMQGTGSAADAADRTSDYDALRSLYDMAGQDAVEVPDMADLMKQARQDSMNNAWVQLGAGIAGDDLAGGLSRAGQIAAQGASEARSLDRASRMMTMQNEKERIQRDASIYGEVAALEASHFRALIDDLVQQGRNENEIMRFVQAAVKSVMDEALILDPAQREEAQRRLYMEMLPPSLVRSRGLEYFTEGAPTAATRPAGVAFGDM